MKRYIINISFKQSMHERVENIVEEYSCKRDAVEDMRKLIDETVDAALIRDNVTRKVEWWKGGKEGQIINILK